MDKQLFEKAVASLAKETGKTIEESKQLLLSAVNLFNNGQIVTTEKREVKIGSLYKHFKGNYYRVLTVSEHTESKEQLVIYQAMYGERKIYAGPLDMFLSRTDKIKYPGVTQECRFLEVEKEKNEVQDVNEKECNYTRATFIVRGDLLDKLKNYAYTDRRTLKDIVNEMIEDYLKDKEILQK